MFHSGITPDKRQDSSTSGGQPPAEGGSTGAEGGDRGRDAGDPAVRPAGSEPLSFRSPLLAGKTEDEIEQMVSEMTVTIDQQGRVINQLQSTRQQPQAPPASPSTGSAPDVPDEPPDLLEDSRGYARWLAAQNQKAIDARLTPIIQTVRNLSSGSVFDKFRADKKNFPGFNKYEQQIRQILIENNGDPSNEGAVQMAYYFARGMDPNPAAPETEASSAPAPTGPPPLSPQNRSSAPPAPGTTGNGRTAPLTEAEAALARRSGMTPEQYRAGQGETTVPAVNATDPMVL